MKIQNRSLPSTGSSGTSGSGDIVVAFSTVGGLRIVPDHSAESRQVTVVSYEVIRLCFEAVMDTTEEAWLSSSLAFSTTHSDLL